MTLNALKEREEIALRIDKNTIALVLNSNEIEEKSNYIISEILNYKWRLYNIYLKLSWKILTIEEYQKECEKEKIF